MSKLFLLLSLLGLFGCQPKDQPTDIAARASGRYAVQSYVVFGDTLYSSKGINKIGVSDFYVFIDRKAPDSVRVGASYTRKGLPIRFLRDVRVSENNGRFQLSAAPSMYEGRIEGKDFYERSIDGGLLIPFADSSQSFFTPSSAGIVISAQK